MYEKYLSKFSLVNKSKSPNEPTNKAIKGLANGECNRTACTNKNAKWFNSSTEKYYCGTCAYLINSYTPHLCKFDKTLNK